jgi:hypothetical protein
VIFFAITAKNKTLPLIILIVFCIVSSYPIFMWEAKISAKTGSLLPFCLDVYNLCDDSQVALWDSSSETDEWDMIIYYTLKFWLADRIERINDENAKSHTSNGSWLITKKEIGEQVITFSKFRVTPLTHDIISGF